MIIIDNIIYSLQKAGGISVYFSEILNKLVANSYQFKVLHYENDNQILKEYQQDKIFTAKKVLLPLVIARYMDVFIPKESKVFHSSYYRLPIFFQRRKVKIVTTVHDFTYERYIGGFSSKIHHWQKKRAVLASDIVICISENTKKDLIHYIPQAKNKDIRVIYNGVSEFFFPLLTDDDSKNKDNILFIGSRVGYKNFNSLVIAMEQLTDMKLVIVGGGSITYDEGMLLEQYCGGRYRHINFVSNEQLNGLYNQAFCLVYPSLYEGFGIPAIEAMRSGCPVIAANRSSIPEVCDDASILLDDVNPNNIAEAVNSLRDKATREKLIESGFNNSSRFSWDNMFQELSKIYLGNK
ncbi:glycosyltransferase family 4 protein [Aeromonas caviae]|uniref:glycosyltransferase family 4 protein n=1 Tax=Aeromonas caviae TaxID=648 RepID=UPI0024CDEECB|nr:glycosyltransferase family 4 protein [Aeromonas caviae]WAF65559.1 glycosyltransferase family 4 protein [Aeromonas caviae]WAF82385.1 glycosyltransferase family 4 protein [Aeromonas caviae]